MSALTRTCSQPLALTRTRSRPRILSIPAAMVGMITSKDDVIKAVAAYTAKRMGDASPASLKKLLAQYARGKDCLDLPTLQAFLDDASACAPWPISCDGTAKRVMDAVDKNGDRCISWDEYRAAAGLPADVIPGPAPAPLPPVSPAAGMSPLSGAMLTVALVPGGASLPRGAALPEASSASGSPGSPAVIGGALAIGLGGLFLLVSRAA